ncbi:MAG TPA: hypothetical protein VGF61_22715 [Candidatus Acidoferrum sp.]|jgi:hypothetical protein
MKQYINVLTLCSISLLSPLVVQSQTIKPAYLSEMPAPARVLAEIKGKDAEDACERQMGAFMALVKMIDDLADGLEHRSDRQLTPDEQRITLVYQQAYREVWYKVKKTYGKQYAGDYDQDRDLLVELLDKFFSANFRTQFFKVNGFAAAWYKKVHANGATSGNGESSNLNTGGAANNSDARLARAIDSSIAKARAANIDTTVFGLQLGEPLRLATCAGPSSLFQDHPTCFYEDSGIAKGIGTMLGSVPDPNTIENWRLVFVHKGPRAEVLLYDGLLAAVKFETGGINDEPQRARDLREKYGPPTLVKPFTYTPRIGNTLKANDLEWRLPGLHVEYSAVLKKPNSSEVITVDGGSIYVETEAAYQRRLAKEKEQAKGKTKM